MVVSFEVSIVVTVVHLRSVITDYSGRSIINVALTRAHVHVAMVLLPAFAYRNQGSRSDSRLSSTLATVCRRAVGSSSCAYSALVDMFGAVQ